MRLYLRPLTLAQANAEVARHHRHHKPVVGHRFSIGVETADGVLHGAVIVGRPVSRGCDQDRVAEVTRLVTDGTQNACSSLYSAAARAAEAMGYDKIQTYILQDETGTSLRAANWTYEVNTRGGNWNCDARPGRRTDQPMQPKQRWARVFKSRIVEPQLQKAES